jgi:hypothetical protein
MFDFIPSSVVIVSVYLLGPHLADGTARRRRRLLRAMSASSEQRIFRSCMSRAWRLLTEDGSERGYTRKSKKQKVTSDVALIAQHMTRRTLGMKCVGRKDVVGVIAHSPIIRVAAMLIATQIVAMPKVSIVCIQNRQPWMSLRFSRTIEVR